MAQQMLLLLIEPWDRYLEALQLLLYSRIKELRLVGEDVVEELACRTRELFRSLHTLKMCQRRYADP